MSFRSNEHLVFLGESGESAHETPCYMEAWDEDYKVILCYQGSLQALALCARVRKFASFQIIRASDGVTLVCGVEGIPRQDGSRAVFK